MELQQRVDMLTAEVRGHSSHSNLCQSKELPAVEHFLSRRGNMQVSNQMKGPLQCLAKDKTRGTFERRVAFKLSCTSTNPSSCFLENLVWSCDSEPPCFLRPGNTPCMQQDSTGGFSGLDGGYICLQLGSSHERAALAEAEIREAVAGEMDELLKDMDASYKVNLPSTWYYILSCTIYITTPTTDTSHGLGNCICMTRFGICRSAWRQKS